MAATQKQIDRYRAGNLEAARIIAADPVKYPGIMQEWARLVLQPLADQAACAACGRGFTGTRADAKTCSAACRQKAYRRRAA